jgi:hypothetical protein
LNIFALHVAHHFAKPCVVIRSTPHSRQTAAGGGGDAGLPVSLT